MRRVLREGTKCWLAFAQALQEIEDNLREEQCIMCEEQLIAFKQARS